MPDVPKLAFWLVKLLPRHEPRSFAPGRGFSRLKNAAIILIQFFLGSAATHAQGISAGFKPDRDVLFQQCAVLNNYEMDASGKNAIAKGRTTLTDAMKAGMSQLLDAWEKHGDDDKRRLAFILATARRESRSTFNPVREAPGCGADEGCRERAIGRLLAERAARKGTKPRSNYALADNEGRRYYGRGFVQLTLKENYARAGEKVGLDLVSNPDDALKTSVAADILLRAMLEGWYGSKRPLSFYIGSEKVDWLRARDNVNPGSPNKPVTAAYAKDFLGCLQPVR